MTRVKAAIIGLGAIIGGNAGIERQHDLDHRQIGTLRQRHLDAVAERRARHRRKNQRRCRADLGQRRTIDRR